MTEEDRPKEEAKLKEEARMKSLQSPEEFRQTPEGRRELALKHKRHMIYGLLWIVGGATVGACTNS